MALPPNLISGDFLLVTKQKVIATAQCLGKEANAESQRKVSFRPRMNHQEFAEISGTLEIEVHVRNKGER